MNVEHRLEKINNNINYYNNKNNSVLGINELKAQAKLILTFN